jgi:enoyl-CoA hydratase/carnithine racemase
VVGDSQLLEEEMSSPTALASDTPALDLREADGILHVHFNRTQADAATIDALYDAVADLEETERFKAVVFHIRPADPDAEAVSGQLSGQIAQLGASDGLRAFSRLEKSLSSLERMNKPAAVVLDGPTGTLGLELALVSDLRLATPKTSFELQEMQRGVLPGMSVFRLARYCGLGTAKQTILLGHPISADQALRFGVIDKIVDRVPGKDGVADDADDSLRNGLKYLTSLPPTALTLARQMLHEGGTMDYRKAYEAYKAAQFHALHQLEEAG